MTICACRVPDDVFVTVDATAGQKPPRIVGRAARAAELMRVKLTCLRRRTLSMTTAPIPYKCMNSSAFAFLGRHQYAVFMRRQMLLDRVANHGAQLIRGDCVEFDTYVAEAFCAAVALLRRPRVQVPVSYLVERQCQALKVDSAFGVSSRSVSSIFCAAHWPLGS